MTEPIDPATVPQLGNVEPPADEQPEGDAAEPIVINIEQADDADEPAPDDADAAVDINAPREDVDPDANAALDSLNAMSMALVGSGTSVSGLQLAAMAEQIHAQRADVDEPAENVEPVDNQEA